MSSRARHMPSTSWHGTAWHISAVAGWRPEHPVSGMSQGHVPSKAWQAKGMSGWTYATVHRPICHPYHSPSEHQKSLQPSLWVRARVWIIGTNRITWIIRLEPQGLSDIKRLGHGPQGLSVRITRPSGHVKTSVHEQKIGKFYSRHTTFSRSRHFSVG